MPGPAITADQVQVVMDVQDTKYLAKLRADEAAFDKTVANMEADAIRAGAAFSRVQLGANGMFQPVIDKAPQATRAVQGMGFQTANVASQLNDIAVQLQAGQSPFIIALQQGSQLNQVFGQQGLRGTLSLLGGAFTSLISPVSLLTIGTIGLVGFAVQYFTSLISDGKVSNTTLKEQEDLIRSVADRWGDAVPALKAYVDELDRAKSAGDDASVGDILRKDAFEGVKAQLETVKPALREVINELAVTGETGRQAGVELGQAFFDMSEKVKDGSATTADFDRVLALVTSLAGDSSSPVFAALAAIVSGLAASFAQAAQAAADVNVQLSQMSDIDEGDKARDRLAKMGTFQREQERVNTLTSDQLALENEIARVKADYASENDDAVLADAVALGIAKDRLAAEERRSKIKADIASGAKADKSADREAEAVLALIEALEFENQIMGLNKEDQAVMNALRKAGAAATDEQRKQIEALVRANYEEAETLRDAKDELQEFLDLGKEGLQTFIDKFTETGDAGKAFGAVLKEVGSSWISGGLGDLFSGTGPLAGLFAPKTGSAFTGGWGSSGLPRRKGGGSVRAGHTYWVGEDGPEPFTPGTNGVVSPNGSMGGTSLVFAPSISAPGADRDGLAVVMSELRNMKAQFVPMVQRVVSGRGRTW